MKVEIELQEGYEVVGKIELSGRGAVGVNDDIQYEYLTYKVPVRRTTSKTIKYRVALMTEGREAWAVIVNTDEEMRQISNYANFERWLTDWVDVEI